MPKAKRIPKNKILSVTIKRMLDESPDTSWLGEYSNKKESEYSIDRAHSEDCASVNPNTSKAQTILEHARNAVVDCQEKEKPESNERYALEDAYNQLNELVDQVAECDCGERGDMQRNEYRYFNPSFNYITKDDKPADGLTDEEVRKYVKSDYERLESLNRGDWCFIGIRAEAEIRCVYMTEGRGGRDYFQTQKITSGGVFGFESDMSQTDFEEVESEQLADLKDQLAAIGFSKRAIATAFKTVEHKEA